MGLTLEGQGLKKFMSMELEPEAATVEPGRAGSQPAGLGRPFEVSIGRRSGAYPAKWDL